MQTRPMFSCGWAAKEGQWQTTHQWMRFSSDNGWILENESGLLSKQEKAEACVSWCESPLRILVRMSGFTNPWCAIAADLCGLFTVHFRAFSWSDAPPKVFGPKPLECHSLGAWKVAVKVSGFLEKTGTVVSLDYFKFLSNLWEKITFSYFMHISH